MSLEKNKKHISLRAHLCPFSSRSHNLPCSAWWLHSVTLNFIPTFCYHKHSYSWLLRSMPVNQLGYTILERQLSRDPHEGNMVCDLPEEKHSRIESGTWKGTWKQEGNKGGFTQLGSEHVGPLSLDKDPDCRFRHKCWEATERFEGNSVRIWLTL